MKNVSFSFRHEIDFFTDLVTFHTANFQSLKKNIFLAERKHNTCCFDATAGASAAQPIECQHVPVHVGLLRAGRVGQHRHGHAAAAGSPAEAEDSSHQHGTFVVVTAMSC